MGSGSFSETLWLRSSENWMVFCDFIDLDRFLHSVVCPLGCCYPQNYYPQQHAGGVFELAMFSFNEKTPNDILNF